MEEKDLKEIYDIFAKYPEACKILKKEGHTVDSIVNILDSAVNNTGSDNLFNNDDFRQAYGDFTLSDFNMKRVKCIANQQGPISIEDLAFIMEQAGNDEDGHGISDEMDWTDEMLDKYAQHLHNYLYTYKESAKQVDPSIDPNEKHIGPMAQDIEQVAPDCVKETDQGVKVVDGNRLALVNAGVIGDLARRLLHLEEVVNG